MRLGAGTIAGNTCEIGPVLLFLAMEIVTLDRQPFWRTIWQRPVPAELSDEFNPAVMSGEVDDRRLRRISEGWRRRCRASSHELTRSLVATATQTALLDAFALSCLSIIVASVVRSAEIDPRVWPPNDPLAYPGGWFPDDEWESFVIVGEVEEPPLPEPTEVVVNIGFIKNARGERIVGPFLFYRGETFSPESRGSLFASVREQIARRGRAVERTVIVIRADTHAPSGLVAETIQAAADAGFQWTALRCRPCE